MTEGSGSARWWGEFELPAELWSRWRIGPLTLYLQLASGEVRIAWCRQGEPLDPTLEIALPAEPQPELEEGRYELSRHVSGEIVPRLRLRPRLADRAVVVRTETPLYIPPGEHTVLYVSSAAWVEISIAGNNERTLLELPVYRPSDTWFGPNTRSGELCYASRTRARTRSDLLAGLAHRPITPIEISNQGSDALLLAQLRVPVTALKLYESLDGRLWTDALHFLREQDEHEATLDLLAGSSHLPAEHTLLSEPRMPMEQHALVGAFSRIFT